MQTSNTMTTFAQNVKAILKKKGITQRQLATMIGMQESDMSDLLNKRPDTKLQTIEAIADALEVSPGSLIDRPAKKKTAAA
jgi:DNA-binding Xre family transcriptional regulator